jgi:hypothetical protein
MENDEGGEALRKHKGFQTHDGIRKEHRETYYLDGIFLLLNGVV